MHRTKILAEVSKRVGSERNAIYGDPATNLSTASRLKEIAALDSRGQLCRVEREALDLILTKVGRLLCGKPTVDSWEDIAGYAAIGAEARSHEKASDAVERIYEQDKPLSSMVVHGTVTGRFTKNKKPQLRK